MLNIENRIQSKQKMFNFIWVGESSSKRISRTIDRSLERTYSMWVPGFGTEDPKQYKKFLSNDALKAVTDHLLLLKISENLFLVIENTLYVLIRQ